MRERVSIACCLLCKKEGELRNYAYFCKKKQERIDQKLMGPILMEEREISLKHNFCYNFNFWNHVNMLHMQQKFNKGRGKL